MGFSRCRARAGQTRKAERAGRPVWRKVPTVRSTSPMTMAAASGAWSIRVGSQDDTRSADTWGVLSTLFRPKVAAAPGSRKPTPIASTAVVDDLAVARQEGGTLLDTLGVVLRAYGRDAFDLGRRSEHEIRALINAWALHATIGAP